MFFFVHLTAPPAIYTLSLHDALPILHQSGRVWIMFERRSSPHAGSHFTFLISSSVRVRSVSFLPAPPGMGKNDTLRSEEHTSELQSRGHLVCRLLLEKKKQTKQTTT